MYKQEEKRAQSIRLLSVIAILLSCLGLFGMAEFSTRNRIREIGIRKVNGAGTFSILRLLNMDFLKWVAVGIVLGAPSGWYFMNRWLTGFAYRISLDWWIFGRFGVVNHQYIFHYSFLLYLCIMHIDKHKISKIKNLCKKHKVKELYLFGSVLGENYKPSSDIDFLIEFAGIDLEDYFDNYMSFKAELKLLLGKEIDLVENKAIRNPIFRRSVDRSKQMIYGREIA